MSLIDLVHAIEARNKGYINDELKIAKGIIENARDIKHIAPVSEMMARSGALKNISKLGKKFVVGAAVVSSLSFGGATVAHARDVGVEAGRKISISATDSVLTKASKLTDIIDTTLALTDKGVPQKKVFAQLYRTGIHESGGLEHLTQMGGGPAKGYFQVEPETAQDIVQRWAARKKNVKAMAILEKTSGLSKRDLLAMNEKQLGNVLEKNHLFSASVARFKYKMDPEALSSSLGDQAKYWQKVYQSGGKDVADQRIKSFIKSNVNFSKRVSSAMLQQKKILHAGGTATSKAVGGLQETIRVLKRILPR